MPAPKACPEAKAADGTKERPEESRAPEAENADPENYDADDETCPDVEMSAGEDAMDTS